MSDPEPTGYTADGVPTFDHVRDVIEGRAATAIGAEELVAETPEGRALAEQEADREQAGRDKLEEIRRSLGR
jgi:phage shock protein A